MLTTLTTLKTLTTLATLTTLTTLKMLTTDKRIFVWDNTGKPTEPEHMNTYPHANCG